MLAHIEAFGAALGKMAKMRFQVRIAVAAGLSALLAGCLQTSPPSLAARDPSDPAARVPSVTYRGTLGSYTRQRPVEPAPWREQNEQVAPAKKP